MSQSPNQKSPLSDIRDKLFALLTEPMDDADFVHWLSSYARRAEALLRPADDRIEPSIRDLISAYRGFANSQQVVDFCHAHKLTLPKNEHWWMMNPENRPAHISGFDGNGNKVDNTHGYPRITNGILVYLERADGSLFLGHRDWLKWERKSRNCAIHTLSPTTVKPTAKDVALATKLVDLGDLSLFSDRYQSATQKPLAIKLSGKRDDDIKNVSSAVREYLDAMIL